MGRYHGISQRSPRPINEYRHQDSDAASDHQWRRIGAQWAAIEPADSRYRVDHVIVKAIRRLDPDFVPLWLTTEHESESGAVVRCVHHAIGWRVRDPHKKHQERRILWPTSRGQINYGMHGYPVLVERIIEGSPGQPAAAFKPLSWDDYRDVEYGIWWQRNEMPVSPEEEARQIVERAEQAKAKEEKRIYDEINYRIDTEAEGAARHLEQIGSAEIQAWGAPREQKKPFVEVRQ